MAYYHIYYDVLNHEYWCEIRFYNGHTLGRGMATRAFFAAYGYAWECVFDVS